LTEGDKIISITFLSEAERITCAQAGEQMGISREAVKKRRQRLPPTPATQERLLKAYFRGKNTGTKTGWYVEMKMRSVSSHLLWLNVPDKDVTDDHLYQALNETLEFKCMELIQNKIVKDGLLTHPSPGEMKVLVTDVSERVKEGFNNGKLWWITFE
jgi:hypothetical protein